VWAKQSVSNQCWQEKISALNVLLRKGNMKEQIIYRFKNNWGASVVRSDGTKQVIKRKGHGDWELALIKWVDDDWDLFYDDEFPDVVKYLKMSSVKKLLSKIQKRKNK
jgi:hypothetical protein